MKTNRKARRVLKRNLRWILIISSATLCLASGVFFVYAYLNDRPDPENKNTIVSDTSGTSETPVESIPPASESAVSSTQSMTSTPPESAPLTPTPEPTTAITATPTSEPTQSSEPTGPVWYSGFVDPRTVDFVIVSNPNDVTVLINKYFAVSEDYVPELVSAASSNSQKLRPESNDAWDLMRAACEADTGYTLYLTAGYSTFQQRLDLFNGSITKYNDMVRTCSKYAYPGRSEHNVGLALDIATTASPTISSNFLNTTAGQWVAEHCHEYGLILRYPLGKESITGYAFEAWHFRYLGMELATELYNSGQTLEEYYGKEQVLP
jgi:D-alanyl-D-alanine carboxypeptidase